MTPVTEHGIPVEQNGTGPASPGAAAMNKLSYTEKLFLHGKLVRFLDGGDRSAMTIGQIAEAVGVSREAVRLELRARNGGQPLRPRPKPARPRRRAPHRARNLPGQPQAQLMAWLEENPGPHTLAEMQAGTGLPKSTVRLAVIALGVTPAPGPRGMHAARRERETVPEPSVLPEGDVRYLSTATDGTLLGLDEATGKVWVLKADHLL